MVLVAFENIHALELRQVGLGRHPGGKHELLWLEDEFLAVPPRQIGIAGQDRHAKLLKALSLFLVSDFANYYQFFTSPRLRSMG